MRPYSSNLSIFTLPHSIAERKIAMQMPLLRGDFGGERVNGGRNKASAFTGKRILTENVGPRTCLPVIHKLSTAIRGIPASMVKNTLRVLRQRQRVCTSFWSGLRGSNSLPASRELRNAIRRNPASPLIQLRFAHGCRYRVLFV